MSLFQAREFWSAATGTEEEFGGGCLAIANLDNDPGGQLKIATGSFSGMLRLYFPREREFKLEDLMLEQDMERPILQLLAGRYLPDSERVAIALLHPKALAVYQVSAGGASGGKGGEGGLPSYFTLTKMYEHPLERPSYNMVPGAFGGVYGREHLCVQSMDGYVSLIEQDRLVGLRQLSKFLLPGPLAYCTKADCFVTFNSQMEIDCYKYSSLSAISTTEKSKAGVEWSSVLAESCVGIVVARCSKMLSPAQVDIVVVGERSLLCYKETGAIRMQRRLDYTPCCCHAYPSLSKEPGAPEHHLMVGTHTGGLMIYRDLELVWAARLPSPAMAVRVGTFASTAGLLVHLSADGDLGLSYLGTDPPANTVATEAKELNYEAMDEEHRRLLQTIREASAGSKPEPADGISLRAQVPNTGEPIAAHAQEECGGAVTMVTVRLFVSYNGPASIESVTLTASCAPPLFLTVDAVTLPSLAGGSRTPTIVPFTFRARTDELPIDLTACVAATYSVQNGEPRCARCEFTLPLSMVARATDPVKSPQFKVTIDTNRPPPPLSHLFEDLLNSLPQLAESISQPGVGQLSVEYHVGLDASVLVSKSAGRYRVQSSSLEGIWLLADELVRRLHAHFNSASQRSSAGVGGGGEEPFAALYAEPLPLQEYFELIDDHLQCRHALSELLSSLAKRAHQLRVIEKRLLVRVKDRNPAPMANLELLFDGTYAQLTALAEQAESAQQQRRFYATRLSAGTRLLLLLLRLRFSLDEEDVGLLSAHLTPIVDETPDQGWQERTDAALTHLLRSGLSKNGREGGAATQATSLTRPADAAKLKKHITLVCDRLHKGLRPKGNAGAQAAGGDASQSL
jgi:Bardet-Biedl syndrome 9 protein